MTEVRRWNYDIYYDEEGDITGCEAIDVTIDDESYDIIEERNRYECSIDGDGQPILDEENVPVPT